jgi:hypothetical protein
MVIINFYSLDFELVGKLNEKIHEKVANAFGIKDEDLIFQASDSFVFYKGHEQTSYNVYIKVEAPVELSLEEEKVASILMEETKDYSIHVRILFSYFDESHYYERVSRQYPEFITTSIEAKVDDEEYDEDREYSEDEIYTGNIFADNGFVDEDDAPLSMDDVTRK